MSRRRVGAIHRSTVGAGKAVIGGAEGSYLPTREGRASIASELLNEVDRAYCVLYEHLATPLGLSYAQSLTLYHLQRADGTGQAQLARELGKSASGLGGMLASLETLGWIRRESNRVDRREKAVFLTARARRSLPTIEALEATLDRRLCHELDERSAQALASTLDKMRASLWRSIWNAPRSPRLGVREPVEECRFSDGKSRVPDR